MKQHLKKIIVSRNSLDVYEANLKRVAKKTTHKLKSLLKEKSGLDVLEILKFEEFGNDPLTPDSPLNFIEQLNQTFTYIASIRACRHIFDTELRVKKITMHLGSHKGSDLVMMNGSGKILGLAEVFAAVDHKNNNKLKKDIEKVSSDAAKYKVSIKRVYFISPRQGEFSIKDLDNMMKRSKDGELRTVNQIFVKRFSPEV